MTFINSLKNRNGQATVEYIVVFIAVVVGILLAFKGLSQDASGIKNIFGLGKTGNSNLIVRITSQLNEAN